MRTQNNSQIYSIYKYTRKDLQLNCTQNDSQIHGNAHINKLRLVCLWIATHLLFFWDSPAVAPFANAFFFSNMDLSVANQMSPSFSTNHMTRKPVLAVTHLSDRILFLSQQFWSAKADLLPESRRHQVLLVFVKSLGEDWIHATTAQTHRRASDVINRADRRHAATRVIAPFFCCSWCRWCNQRQGWLCRWEYA